VSWRRRRLFCGALCCILQLAILVGCGGSGNTTGQAQGPSGAVSTSATDFRTIGSNGYIYGQPMVDAYRVLYEYSVNPNSGQYQAPFNQIHNNDTVYTPADTAFDTPNSDTPYSFMWMDLRAEPMVLSVPAVDPARYYSVMLCDQDTFNFGYIGTRATGSAAGSYLVVAPDWSGPTVYPGIKQVFRSDTQFALAMYRTQLFNPQDLPNVVAVQAGYKAQPLSPSLGQAAPPPAPAVSFPAITASTVNQNFFAYLDFILNFSPPGPEEIPIRTELAKIGVGPYKRFNYASLSDDQKALVQLGMADGMAQRTNYLWNTGIAVVQGWQTADLFGDRAFFNGDWMKRAAGAQTGLFANDSVEAVYPGVVRLPNGDVLDGSKHNYALTFASGQLPPVNAFWSVTMYDQQTRLLVQNPINRYLINSEMLPQLHLNADGSLTIYIQKDSPGAANVSNWLPAPDGPIYMVLRMYWPRTSPPSILPIGQGTWNPPGLVQTN
jgi:hypothetical protein